MEFTTKDVDYIAKLSRLYIEDEKNQAMANELTNILKYVEKLNELDASDIEPTANILGVQNIFREDEIFSEYNREELLKNAPQQKDGCFCVPKIVE